MRKGAFFYQQECTYILSSPPLAGWNTLTRIHRAKLFGYLLDKLGNKIEIEWPEEQTESFIVQSVDLSPLQDLAFVCARLTDLEVREGLNPNRLGQWMVLWIEVQIKHGTQNTDAHYEVRSTFIFVLATGLCGWPGRLVCRSGFRPTTVIHTNYSNYYLLIAVKPPAGQFFCLICWHLLYQLGQNLSQTSIYSPNRWTKRKLCRDVTIFESRTDS